MKENLYDLRYGETQAREIAPKYKEIISEWLKPNEEDTILELGFGSGDILDFLKDHCPQVFGTDINKEWLEKLKKPETIASDARQLPLKESAITKSLSLHTLEHIKELDQVFRELDRITVNGGLSFHAFPANLITRLEGALNDAKKLTKNPLEMLRLAGKFHPHKLDPDKIQKFLEGTNWKLINSEKIPIPEEGGSAWFILLKKEEKQ